MKIYGKRRSTEGAILICLPAKLMLENPHISTQKLTHQNAITSEKNGQFLFRIQQKATSNNISFAASFWFGDIFWPFEFM
jgi:hypothetical protein